MCFSSPVRRLQGVEGTSGWQSITCRKPVRVCMAHDTQIQDREEDEARASNCRVFIQLELCQVNTVYGTKGTAGHRILETRWNRKHRGGNAELYMRANLPLYLLRKLQNTLRPSLQGRPQSSGVRMCGRMKSCRAVLVHLGWKDSRREKSTTGWAPQGIGGEDSAYVYRQYGHGRTHVGYSFCDRSTEGRIGKPYIGQTQSTIAYTPSKNALLHFVTMLSACTTIANPHGLTALPIWASTNGI